MTRTNKEVGNEPEGKDWDLTPLTAADRVTEVLKVLEGRWKFAILFQLFGGNVRRFSDLERAIPGISQKMLTQQLRQMESDGLVRRVVHPQVPPKVEYRLTEWGQDLCPVLDALLRWAERRDDGRDATPASDEPGE